MKGLQRLGRRGGATLALALLIASLGPAPASAADPLAKVALAIASETIFDTPSLGGEFGEPGSWALERGRMANGQLTLHLEITPVRQTLRVKSGPAVLFAAFSLYGDAGGDVGIDMNVRPVTAQVIPACADDDHCRYAVDVSIPLAGLADAIARLEQHGNLIWVSADMTLVRTFGGGRWLQVAAFQRSETAAPGASGGRLGSVVATHGVLNWSGLFPASEAIPIPDPNSEANPPLDYGSIVESLRKQAGDTTEPPPAVDVDLNVRIVRSCVGWMELTFHDDLGNSAFYANEIPDHPEMHASTSMPVGSPWFLTLDGGDGVQAPIVRLGPIQSDGSGAPVTVSATMDCATRTGTLTLTGAVTPTPNPTRPPLPSVGPVVPTLQPSATPAATPAPAGDATPVAYVVIVAVGLLGAFMLRRRRPS